jgi:hypothetical protein
MATRAVHLNPTTGKVVNAGFWAAHAEEIAEAADVGAGAVRSINGIEPVEGDVTLEASDVGAASASDVATLSTTVAGKAEAADLTAHTAATNNPHSVTKAQVGLGNCDNTSDASKPISTATQAALDAKASASALTTHTSNVNNPHSVTKAQVGLGNCDNTSDADKPVSTAMQTALDAKADSSHTHTLASLGFTLVGGDLVFTLDGQQRRIPSFPVT